MDNYKFVFNEKNYELKLDNCDELLNDEEYPVTGIDNSKILTLLNQGKEVNFDKEYYEEICPKCKAGKLEKAKYYRFLEYHFYIFTKDGEYVISSISEEYENTSYNRLLKKGKADNSYIVNIIVCEVCGNYFVEIENCEV